MKNRLTIGLLIEVEGTVDIEGYKTILRTGVVDYLREQDCHLICFAGGALQKSPYALEEKKRNLIYQMIDPQDLDGIIVVPTIGMSVADRVFQEFLHRYAPLPVVAAGALIPDYPSVSVDNWSGVESLCKHLFEHHRYRQPVYIGGPRENPDSESRLAVFREMLNRYELSGNKDRIREGAFTIETGRIAAQELLDQPGFVCDAILCANDHMALGVISELSRRGISIPKQIAVTGFDDGIKALAALPPLTTIRQPIYEIGRESARLLLQWIRTGERPKNIQLPTQLVIRQSCGCEESVYNNLLIPEPAPPTPKPVAREDSELPKKKSEQTLTTLSLWLEEPPEQIQKWLDVLTTEAKESDAQRFFESLKKFFRDPNRSERISRRWQDILAFLKGYLLPPGGSGSIVIAVALEKIRVLAMEYERNRESLRKLESDLQLEKLYRIGQLLYEQFDLTGISKILKSELPALGITSFFAALYETPDEMKEGEIAFQVLPEHSRTFSLYDSSPASQFRSHRKIQTRTSINVYLSLSTRAKQAILEPLFYKNHNLGFILVECGPMEGFFYETLRSQISGALFEAVLFRELQEKNRLLANIADRDGLTGLYNHTTIHRRLRETLEAAQRNLFSISFLMIDVDGFKTINDTFGHSVGDQVLLAISACLHDELDMEEDVTPPPKSNRIVRRYDIAGRYGGDEFCIILPHCGKHDAQKVAERIFRRVTAKSQEMLQGGKISLSIGVASLERGTQCAHAQEIEQLSDFALYQAKQQGKNRIEVFTYPHPASNNA